MKNIKILSAVLGLAGCLSACQLSTNPDASEKSTKQNTEVNSEVTTFARFVPERNDDFAWENDLVAFRMYGPTSRKGAENAGLDCWLKRVKTPVINKWYKQELEQEKTYHKDWGEGLDNYHVGSSAGCGSSALWLNGKRQPLETFVEWEVLQQSKQKSSFALMYRHEIDGVEYKERKEIEIELGKRLFKVVSTFWQDDKLAVDVPISVGLTTHDELAITSWNKNTGTVAAWEIKDGFGLGTGVIVDPKKIDNFMLVPSLGIKDAGHVLLLTKTDAQGQVVYYAGYGWQKAQEITTFNQWKEYLNEFSIQ